MARVSDPVGLQRRVVVALFVDISGFTAMVESSDVEDVHDNLRAAFADAEAEVRAHGGTVEKYAGDALLALFGAQRAHRDDVDRAIAAALRIRERLAARPQPLAVRAGIEMGEALVDMQRLQSARDLMVVGDAVNTAARLQQAAQRGEVLVGPAAAGLASAALGATRSLELKGKENPVAAAPVEGEPRAPLAGGTMFVGRARELAALRDSLHAAGGGNRARVLGLVGPPGIGKTRLLRELAGAADAPVLWTSCPPPGEGSVAEVLRALLAIDIGDGSDGDAATRLARAHGARVPADPDPNRLGELLAITAGLDHASVDQRSLVWSGRGAEARVAWRDWLGGVAAQAPPRLLVVDDAHWAGQDLIDVLGGALAGTTAPLLAVLTAWEPHALQAWQVAGDAVIHLDGLADDDARALLAARDSADDDRVVAAAEGNPLYLQTVARHATAGDGVPLGVRAAVTARIDSLPASLRHAVGVAAVLGHRVDARALAAVTGGLPDQGAALCGALVAEDVLVAHSDGGYGFRHQLLASCAYAAITRRDRRALHAVAADWLLGQAAADDAELARHLDAAERAADAVAAYRRAADQAMRRLEVRTADALLQRAVELCDDDATAAEVWLSRGHVHFACGQADAARDAFARSVELSTNLDSAHRSRALSGRATMTFWTYDMAGAHADARAAVQAARVCGEPAVIAEAEAALALVRSGQGRPGAAIRLADSARELAARSGLDGLSAMAGMVGVLVHHHAGRSAHAATLVDGVAADCRRAGLPVPLVWALYKGGLACAGIGDFAAALRCWDELEVVAHKTDNASFLAETANCRGHVARELGAFGRADELDHQCLDAAPQLGAMEACANATLNLAATALARGQLDEAAVRVDAAVPYLSAREFYRWRYTQRFRYYRARLLLAAGDVDAARTLAAESLQLGRRAGTGKNTLRPLLLLADIRAGEDPVGARDDFLRIARRAASLHLDPIAWRAYAAAADIAAGDVTATARSRAGAVAVLRRIEQRVPDAWRDSFRANVAAPVEDGARDAWRLPL